MLTGKLPAGLTPMQDAIRIQQIGFEHLDIIRKLNVTIFEEERVINTFDREDLLMLLAYHKDEPIGFKIGYRQDAETFYSAKGGVLSAYRRQGIARIMLYDMVARVKEMGFTRFTFDTFPNKHPGMTILGLEEGFHVSKADFNTVFQDYRLQFEKAI